jgi:hypothetical protein
MNLKLIFVICIVVYLYKLMTVKPNLHDNTHATEQNIDKTQSLIKPENKQKYKEEALIYTANNNKHTIELTPRTNLPS